MWGLDSSTLLGKYADLLVASGSGSGSTGKGGQNIADLLERTFIRHFESPLLEQLQKMCEANPEAKMHPSLEFQDDDPEDYFHPDYPDNIQPASYLADFYVPTDYDEEEQVGYSISWKNKLWGSYVNGFRYKDFKIKSAEPIVELVATILQNGDEKLRPFPALYAKHLEQFFTSPNLPAMVNDEYNY